MLFQNETDFGTMNSNAFSKWNQKLTMHFQNETMNDNALILSTIGGVSPIHSYL